ncbi:9453_t:CDS:2 [Ambispora gerdemannii]|uniref:9453_t:CDS:1 n=1 Tax=Ambispora gerdemannii TaxID=144530 RepID=A0A9N9AWI1_9GLOM|nr:9453_t:CDS:2 [Ambispora gerdemannii]
MSTATEENSSELQAVIEKFFKNNVTWSLLKFLQYRKGVDDFTYDKTKEHRLYKRALTVLANDQARTYLLRLRWVQGLEYVPVPRQLRDILTTPELRVISITQLDGYVPTGCQATSRVMDDKSSENVFNFWTRIEEKCYEDKINIARTDGVLHIFKATNQSQQLVTNIQHQDLLGLYQSRDEQVIDMCFLYFTAQTFMIYSVYHLSPIRHSSKEDNPFIEAEDIIIDDVPCEFLSKMETRQMIYTWERLMCLYFFGIIGINSYSNTMIDHFGLPLLDEIHQKFTPEQQILDSNSEATFRKAVKMAMNGSRDVENSQASNL